MIRPVALLAVAAFAAASLVTAPSANAGGETYRHFRLLNPTTIEINYAISWDAGKTWTNHSLRDSWNWIHWNTREGVSVKIRFDADMTNGEAWRTYDLRVTRSPFKPTAVTDSDEYVFRLIGESLLDLKLA
jgi:hypothetical protein